MSAECSLPDLTPAEALTVLAAPSAEDLDTTKRRFEFILPRLVQWCPDIESDARASDMVAGALTLIERAGLKQEEGGMLGLGEALHSVTADSLEFLSVAVMPDKCTVLWAAYIHLRKEGWSQDEAIIATPVGLLLLRANQP